MAELTAPFVYKNDDKRIVYGPVLIPDEPDTDNDVVTAEHIENVAHKFVEEYGNIDVMHSLNNVGRLVESYILPFDLEVDKDNSVPEGSWMMGVRVTDEDAWKSVKDGKLGGFSIMAMQKTAMKSAEKDKENKRVTLADLGDNWIVNAVSLVDEPAVPKAKWIAIKSKDDSNSNSDNDINNETVKKAVDGSLEHRKRLIDQKLENMFASYERFPIIHSTMTDSVIFRIHDDRSGTRKTFQVGYQLDENGNIEFTEEPKEVRIEESVVEINNMLGGQKSKDTTEEENETSEGFMSKFMKGIGLGGKTSEKAGKTISNSNFKKLQQAREVIDDLLSIGEKERESKSKSKEGAEKMEKDDVQGMIDKSLEPFNSKLDDVLKSIKGEATGEGEQQGEGSEGNEEGNQSSEKGKGDDKEGKEGKEDSSTKSKDDEQGDEYKEKYEAVLKELADVKKVPFSNRISGQDNGSEKSKDDEKSIDRNAFGFKASK